MFRCKREKAQWREKEKQLMTSKKRKAFRRQQQESDVWIYRDRWFLHAKPTQRNMRCGLAKLRRYLETKHPGIKDKNELVGRHTQRWGDPGHSLTGNQTFWCYNRVILLEQCTNTALYEYTVDFIITFILFQNLPSSGRKGWGPWRMQDAWHRITSNGKTWSIWSFGSMHGDRTPPLPLGC